MGFIEGFEYVLDLHKSEGDFPHDFENRLNTVLSLGALGLGSLSLVFSVS